ncbi:uncharacterized protein LOC8285865 [Ricinus communis]|uniref:Uncharacterized protein n=1 Tax=Ricinus communis TaxID=3988 RepID=B9SFN7_RICCO|nr:uncharacterized protein LOC8285865 [Ricinus communis]EEF37649.1 conserved hypothetical protein [Ricinus communis]|eukprot:XP_025014126.1 uncharacterized protein LOC8285865 [Ricinus communis]
MDVYEKINKAVIVCSAIQAMRGVSPANSLAKIPVKTIEFHYEPYFSKHHRSAGLENGEADDAVLINFDYSCKQPPPSEKHKPLVSIQKNTQVAKVSFRVEPYSDQESRANPKVGSPQCNTQEGRKLGVQVEDSVTDYINRVKNRMSKSDVRSVSNVSDGKNVSRKDEFSEYINRAGIKIRTTSGIGAGRF